MDILYTVDEKYLQAVEELHYGELPKALHLFNEIVNSDPDYSRAYYQLGCFHHYHFKNYQSAGYYYKRCIALDSQFPDVYVHYLKLLTTLKLHHLISRTAEKALLVPGVSKADIYECLGIYAEDEQKFESANMHYKKAALLAANQSDHSLFQDHLKRINDKLNSNQKMMYAYQG